MPLLMLTCRDSPAWLVVVRTVQQQLVCHVVLDVGRVVSDVCRVVSDVCRVVSDVCRMLPDVCQIGTECVS